MGPLSGIRVLDFSRHQAGAGVTRVLGNYGAEIIRVEWSEHPALDFMRLMFSAEGIDGFNRGGQFNTINVDKLGITLNMREPEALAIAKRVMAVSDVFVENMTPRVMKGFGLDYSSAKEIRPDIVYLSVSGWGQDGPRANFRSYGHSSAAHAGVAFVGGLPERPPAGWQFAYCDQNPAWQGAYSVMMGLHRRRRSGRGVFIDMGQTQTSVTYVAPFILDYTVNGRKSRRPGFPPGNHRENPRVAPHNVFKCAGVDNWCVITVYTADEWRGLKKAMGNPAWAEDPKFAGAEGRWTNQEELEALIGAWTIEFDRNRLSSMLQDHGVPAGAVQTPRDRVEWDPQLEHRQTYQIYNHHEVGPRRYETVAAKLSDSPYTPRHPAPMIGQHNPYVFSELLGMSVSEVERLESQDLIRTHIFPEGDSDQIYLPESGPPRSAQTNGTTESALKDVLVLELGDEGTQYSGKLLAEMGARVIKIEPPQGANCRHRGPFKDDTPDPNGSVYFWAYNTSKESLVLDLTTEADQARLRTLANKADILLEDFSPGYLASLGLGHSDLSKENPGLITVSVTSFGQTGPMKDWKGNDLVHWAMGGNMWLVGYDDADTTPICPQGDHSYIIGGHWATIGAMAALEDRDGKGTGQHVDVSIHEACSLCTQISVPIYEYTGEVIQRHDFLGGAVKCKDGRYFIPQMVNITPIVWSRFVDWLKEIGAGEELYDEMYLDSDFLNANMANVLEVIREIASQRTAEELWVEGQRMGFTWMVFNSPEELLEDEQLKFREFFKTVEHPEHGTSYQYAGAPYHWSEAPWRLTRRPPLLGEHNDLFGGF